MMQPHMQPSYMPPPYLMPSQPLQPRVQAGHLQAVLPAPLGPTAYPVQPAITTGASQPKRKRAPQERKRAPQACKECGHLKPAYRAQHPACPKPGQGSCLMAPGNQLPAEAERPKGRCARGCEVCQFLINQAPEEAHEHS
jgi:hypothetical protein